MIVTNISRDGVLGSAITIADTSTNRRSGLLKHDMLPPGEGLLITPCEGVHTFGMKFPIDTVFLSRSKKVLKFSKHVPKRRISPCLARIPFSNSPPAPMVRSVLRAVASELNPWLPPQERVTDSQLDAIVERVEQQRPIMQPGHNRAPAVYVRGRARCGSRTVRASSGNPLRAGGSATFTFVRPFRR